MLNYSKNQFMQHNLFQALVRELFRSGSHRIELKADLVAIIAGLA